MTTIVDLKNSNLSRLPENIPKTVEKLYLQDNNLTQLPESIGNLSKLQMLILTSNPLEYLPDNIGKLSNLLYLSVANTNLTSLPETLSKLSKLEVLDLSNTHITSEKHLPKNFTNLHNLKQIMLNDTFEIGKGSIIEYLKNKRVKVALYQVPQFKNAQTQQTRELRRKYSELKRAHAELNEENVELRENIQEKISIITNLKSDNSSISKKIKKLTLESQALQNELDKNLFEYTKILQQKRIAQKQNQNQKQNRQPLQKNRQQNRTNKLSKQLSEQLSECNSYNSDLLKKLKENASEIKILNSTIGKNKNAMKILNHDIDLQNLYIEELNEQSRVNKHTLEKVERLKTLMSSESLDEKSARDLNDILMSFA